jgi:hypothetical protein
MATDRYTRVPVLVLRRSTKALLCTDPKGVQECWIPFSLIDADTLGSAPESGEHDLMVQTWFVKKESLDNWSAA